DRDDGGATRALPGGANERQTALQDHRGVVPTGEIERKEDLVKRGRHDQLARLVGPSDAAVETEVLAVQRLQHRPEVRWLGPRSDRDDGGATRALPGGANERLTALQDHRGVLPTGEIER